MTLWTQSVSPIFMLEQMRQLIICGTHFVKFDEGQQEEKHKEKGKEKGKEKEKGEEKEKKKEKADQNNKKSMRHNMPWNLFFYPVVIG